MASVFRSRLASSSVALLAALIALAGCSSSANDASPATSGPTQSGSATTSGATTAGAGTSGTTGSAVTPSSFTVLHAAVGYGLLRVMTLEERPNPREVVIYNALPNELPRVAGVITTVAQTPLSHVNLRAIQDDVPNAVVANALDDPAVQGLVGRYVKYTVAAGMVTIAAATQSEVEAHYAASRPTEAQTPERNLTVRAITPLSQIGFADWTTFGVKAANLATLATLGLPNVEVPTGYAVPFSFYDEFMKANGFYDRVAKMLADPAFRADPALQDQQLAKLRDDIKAAPMPAWIETALATVKASYPADTSLRCRSSTNNEDLPNFSGAGLYDSKTQHPDEGPLSKCIKQVYASVWNLRAYLERDFYRIDHLATAMGVVLYPSFSDEHANGVAVSIDPVFDTPGAYYVNAQLGEDLVTNPVAASIPEAMLLAADGTVGMITHSNLIEPGTRLLTDAQVATLRASLTIINDRFKALYKPAAGSPFAMEIEFKINNTGSVTIKQARTWIFN